MSWLCRRGSDQLWSVDIHVLASKLRPPPSACGPITRPNTPGSFPQPAAVRGFNRSLLGWRANTSRHTEGPPGCHLFWNTLQVPVCCQYQYFLHFLGARLAVKLEHWYQYWWYHAIRLFSLEYCVSVPPLADWSGQERRRAHLIVQLFMD